MLSYDRCCVHLVTTRHCLGGNDLNTDEICRRKVDDALSNVAKLFEKQPPDTLYHYTTAEGLHGLVKSRTVWATDIRYLNDPFEFLYGVDVWDGFKKENPHTYDDLLDQVEAKWKVQSRLREIYVMCFCQVDDLLSQWRSYSESGGGYCIGFTTSAIDHVFNQCVNKYDRLTDNYLVPIIYEREAQLSRLKCVVQRVFHTYSDLSSSSGAQTIAQRESLVVHASVFVLLALASFKSCHFKEEREWRFAVFSGAQDDVSFRPKKGLLIPYKCLALGLQSAIGHPLPIERIRCGPTLREDATEESVRRLLDTYGLEAASVSRSSFQLRW